MKPWSIAAATLIAACVAAAAPPGKNFIHVFVIVMESGRPRAGAKLGWSVGGLRPGMECRSVIEEEPRTDAQGRGELLLACTATAADLAAIRREPLTVEATLVTEKNKVLARKSFSADALGLSREVTLDVPSKDAPAPAPSIHLAVTVMESGRPRAGARLGWSVGNMRPGMNCGSLHEDFPTTDAQGRGALDIACTATAADLAAIQREPLTVDAAVLTPNNSTVVHKYFTTDRLGLSREITLTLPSKEDLALAIRDEVPLRWKKTKTLWRGPRPFAAAFSRDGKTLAAVAAVGVPGWTPWLRTWSVGDWLPHRSLKLQGMINRNSIAFTPDPRFAFLNINGGLKLVNVAAGTLDRTLWPLDEEPEADPEDADWVSTNDQRMTLSGDGRFMAVGGFHRSGLRVFDARSGQDASAVLPGGFESPPRAYALSPDGKHLALDMDQGIEIWRTDAVPWTRDPSADMPLKPFFTPRLSFSPDGKYLAIGDVCFVHVYSVETWQSVADLPGDEAIFEPRGRSMASLETGGSKIKFWSVGSWKSLGEFDTGHGAAFPQCGEKYTPRNRTNGEFLTSVNFSPDGLSLAVAWHGRTMGSIEIWERAP